MIARIMNDEAPAHLLDYDLDALTDWAKQHDLPAYRVRQILEWVLVHNANTFDEMSNLPKRLREELAAIFTIYASTIAAEQRSDDGTVKLLLRWPDGLTSECVFLPETDRNTACLSSQVGCPVQCAFCASGIDGIQRQLTTGEIVEQMLRVRALCAPGERLSNIVFMGIGEPLANYDAVLAAVRTANAPWGLNISARKITISTVGLPDRIRRLADNAPPVTLAISLHATTDTLRQELIPWARRVSIAELTEAAGYYFDRTGREITLEYLMLGSVNMRSLDVERLARLAQRLRCNVNLIAYNPVADLGFERPGHAAVQGFLRDLREHGVNAHVRRSRGLDIDAACGQLRRRDRIEPIDTMEVQI